MRVSLSLPTHRVDVPEFVSAAGITAMATAAEQAGFDAVFVTEHPFPGDTWLATGGHHALDPFVALALVAGATERLRLQTNLVIAAYRNPFLLAKAIASLDAVSGGRTIIGIGAGYLEPEYAALGVDMAERNALTDEAITSMRAAWTGESVTLTGRHWRADANTMLPRPTQRPGPPIWIGGNSARAMRRAVELGDGWAPMLTTERSSSRVRSWPMASVADLGARVVEAREHAAAVGRKAPFDVAFSPAGQVLEPGSRDSGARLADHAAELADAGVTYLSAGVPGATLAEVLDNIAWFGADVLPAVAAVPAAPHQFA
jgi:probable F420-dependent oxidoreductase